MGSLEEQEATMKRSLITLGVILGGLLLRTLPGGAAVGGEVEQPAAVATAPLEFPELGLPDLEFAGQLQEEVFWVQGRLAARGVRADYEGSLHVEGDWPGASEGTFRSTNPGQACAAWVFDGRCGQRLVLRADADGSLTAEIRCPGQPVRTERWLPAGDPVAELEVSTAPGSGAVQIRYELGGTPLDLELAIVSEDPAFAELEGLVYLESLGRRPLGRHLATWSGRDRSAAAERVPPGRYRVELRERQFLLAPGSQPRERAVASAQLLVPQPITSPQ
jgi:hypothetical protein